MARRPKPWYFEQRNQWFVKINGKRVLLGDHPDSRKPKKGKNGWNVPPLIEAEFQSLLSSPKTRTTSVIQTLDDFLIWAYENRAKKTADRYKEF